MTILVYGLLDEQKRIIQEEFPDLPLRFGHKGSKHGQSTRDAADRAEKVVVMANFVSHGLTGSLDKGKTKLIRGGLTRLREHLRTLNRSHEPMRPKLQSKPALSVSNLTSMKAKPEKLRLGALRKTAVGEVLEVPRPPQMTIVEFRRRLDVLRSYYKKQHGIVTECSFAEGKADLLVTSRGSKKSAKPIPGRPIEGEAELWRETMVQAMGWGHEPEAARERADQTCEWYRLRFAAPEGEK